MTIEQKNKIVSMRKAGYATYNELMKNS